MLAMIGMSRFASRFDKLTFDEFLYMNDEKLKALQIQMLNRRAIVAAVVTYKMNKGLL
jgi:hypothetical protein